VTWGSAVWDADLWEGGPPPSDLIGKDWSVWYQFGNGIATGMGDLSGLLVEARWTTDSHSRGDGTYRGDIQPGAATVRFWDPDRVLDNMQAGAGGGSLWLLYKPTGACWCYFYETFARGVFTPGDPMAADCVFTGTTWNPSYLNARPQTAFAAQAVTARLNAIVASIATVNTAGVPITAAVATQNQQCPAVVADSNGHGPSYLQSIRNAAADGVAWLAASAPIGGPGQAILHYERWETVGATRRLSNEQIVAGPPTTNDYTTTFNVIQWAGANAAGTSVYNATQLTTYGDWQNPQSYRLVGNVNPSGGAEYTGVLATSNQLFEDLNQVLGPFLLSSVSLQSGNRATAAGADAGEQWDPYTMVYGPADKAVLDVDGQGDRNYRVTQTSHRLTARVWQAVHTLELFSAPYQLPT
jgi:hypothetical protein